MTGASANGDGQAGGEQGATAGPRVSGRRQVTAALLVAMMVTAMEQLVVSPAMPTIIAQLKGFEIYPWVVSAYLLASTVSTPIYGKLADLFGRKRILLFGLVLFSVGSMLSGTAQSMGQLIAMRTVQGLGAGAVGPIVVTLLGDMFTLEERARIQGLFSTVWGLSSIAGPLVGGWLTVNLNWRWVFFMSVPFAVVASLMLAWCLHERVERRTVAPIDWAGAGLLTAGLSTLLLIVLDGSSLGMQIDLVLAGLTAVLLVGFVYRELHAEDPILPMDLMIRPTIATAVIGNFLIGGILFGIETYVPLFMQGVRGGDAREAGQALTPLFLAWAVSVAFAAPAVVRWGFRRGGTFGAGLVVMGVMGLIAGAMFPAWARLAFTVALIVVGMGMGPASLSFILAVQQAVRWGQRGGDRCGDLLPHHRGSDRGGAPRRSSWLGAELFADLSRRYRDRRWRGAETRDTPPAHRCEPRDGPVRSRPLAPRPLHTDAGPGPGHAALHGLAAGQVGNDRFRARICLSARNHRARVHRDGFGNLNCS